MIQKVSQQLGFDFKTNKIAETRKEYFTCLQNVTYVLYCLHGIETSCEFGSKELDLRLNLTEIPREIRRSIVKLFFSKINAFWHGFTNDDK